MMKSSLMLITVVTAVTIVVAIDATDKPIYQTFCQKRLLRPNQSTPNKIDCGTWNRNGNKPQPWMAIIVNQKYQTQSYGSLIGPKLVLTNSFQSWCADEKEFHKVHFATANFLELNRETPFWQIEEIKARDTLHDINTVHDIVLLVLKTEVDFVVYPEIVPVCFPANDYNHTVEQYVITCSFKKLLIDKRKGTEILVLTHSQDTQNFEKIETKDDHWQLLQGDQPQITDSYNKKTIRMKVARGGPVTYETAKGQAVLLGIEDEVMPTSTIELTRTGTSELGFLEVNSENVRNWIIKEAGQNCITYEPST